MILDLHGPKDLTVSLQKETVQMGFVKVLCIGMMKIDITKIKLVELYLMEFIMVTQKYTTVAVTIVIHTIQLLYQLGKNSFCSGFIEMAVKW